VLSGEVEELGAGFPSGKMPVADEITFNHGWMSGERNVDLALGDGQERLWVNEHYELREHYALRVRMRGGSHAIGVRVTDGTTFKPPQRSTISTLAADKLHEAFAVELTIQLDPFDTAQSDATETYGDIGANRSASDHVRFAPAAPAFPAPGRKSHFKDVVLTCIAV
jgi:hypothetical protein